MTFEELKALTSPEDLPTSQFRALWKDLHGDWDGAHTIVMVLSDPLSMWIHAYLHRKEPDPGNAAYWYRRCGKPYPPVELTADAEAAFILETM